MSVIVRMNDGQVFKVKGDRWIEPPIQPSRIPGVMKNTEIEVDRAQAREVQREVGLVAEQGHYLIHGRDWEYHPITESLFIVVFQGGKKVASFNPTEVDAIGFEDSLELVPEDEE